MPPRQQFGTTWWGRAWVDALEHSATLDPSRLARGRTYARNGNIRSLTIHPGYVAAEVLGEHHRLYRVDIGVRKLAPSEWEQVADAIASRAAHAAALLDGELDIGVVADVAAADVRLLPGPGDLRPDCSCPDWAEPCKHASAVCYQVAAELDRDPFCLFLLRGMGRADLMALVRERRTGDVAEAGAEAALAGIDPTEAWGGAALDRPLDPLPEQLKGPSGPLRRAGTYTRWEPSGSRRRSSPVDLSGLDELAVDAIERAWAMVVDGRSSGLSLSRRADLARRAFAAARPAELAALARRAGVGAEQLKAWAEAWGMAGSDGVAVVADDDGWSTDQELLAAGRDQLVAVGHNRRSVALNYDSLRLKDGTQLVVGHDGQWYAVQARGRQQDLHLVAGPTDDVTELVDRPPAGS